MPKSFLPAKDADLLAWAANFASRISSSPATYGLNAGQSTTFSALNSAYSSAYTTAINPSTRTKGTIAAKQSAKSVLRSNASILARVVEGTITVSNQQKIDLGINVRKARAPIVAPNVAPKMSFVSVIGTTVKAKLEDATSPGRRGRPVGVQGASIFSFVGPTPPAQIQDWVFQGLTSKTTVDIEFDPALAPGTRVHLLAFWYNPRSQSGPACQAISTNLQGGMSLLAA